MTGHFRACLASTCVVIALVGCGSAASPQSPSGTPSAGPTAAGPAPSSLTDSTIASAQHLLAASPDDASALDQLAGAYLQKVREVGDPTYYGKVATALQRALTAAPNDTTATILMGTLLAARHDFRGALAWGQKAEALNPGSAVPLGVVGDALDELGRYDEAFATFQRMVDMRPDLASYSRVSYARELQGDVPGAITAMHEAVVAGGPYPENTAYVQTFLGILYFNSGHLDDAEAQYRQVLLYYPDYVNALAADAQVKAARGDLKGAEALNQRAIDIYPLPQYVVSLGDIQAAEGKPRAAEETYGLADTEEALFRANGVDLDQELALYDADHGRHLDLALAAAQRAVHDRPSIQSYDAYAWCLFHTGDPGGALAASRQAHRLGTKDPLLFFHTGMIEAKLGMVTQARADLTEALALNPSFSVLHAPEARAALAALPAS